MNSPALRGLLILIGAFMLCFLVFMVQGVPFAAGGERTDSTILAILLAGAYSLVSLGAIVFARGVLALFIDFSRPIVFFRALAGVTDPLMALFAPITPGFLHPAFRPFYAAFCLFFIKIFLFGGFGAPPLLLYLVITILFALA